MPRTSTVFLSLLLSSGLLGSAAQAADALKLSVYQADENSFNVTSVLVSGEKDAVLIDSGFTRADAYRIAARVLDSGKTLKAIYISQADPDYYFGATVLKQIFPQAELLAAAPTLARIKSNIAGKVAFWGPKMGTNAPQAPLTLPKPLKGSQLTLEGQAIEVRGTSGLLAHRGYVWIPSIRAIVGNIGVVSGLHVWTADTQSKQERQAWLSQLNEMEALQPKQVIPGHMAADAPTGLASIRFTRSYLQQFEQNLAVSATSAELIQHMQQAFPQAGEALSLEIGAKVNKGEMKW
ncbi:MBL fold metallo-hydrolase [Aquitalea denitrificans]|uniref:MBL fold metallo-hydrolase n=1 Tax=Aquitalea denitrificans TaxID=519081 RepID=UPI00135CB31A|nr:MBL fold metallo-hydrolase [Aquitalea denitrificans]